MAGALGPANAREERDRLTRAPFDTPRWAYTPFAEDRRGSVLLAAAELLRAHADDPLAEVLAARAEELAFHTHLATLAGSPRLAEALASRRFDDVQARALAEEWAEERPAREARSRRSSGPGATLEVALRDRLRALRIDWPVIVRPQMAALAATGEGFVAVTEGRAIGEETLERTVVHEIEGHVRPRVEAARSGHPLAGIGSAGGPLAQEGWAVLCEERTGLLTPTRRHELAWRYLACARMLAGEGFVAVRRALEDEAAFLPEAALALAERVFRGSHGVAPGLGRESAYLVYYVRIREHLAQDPDAEAHYRAAEITPEACRALSP
jgi:hypothetical protein